MSGDASCDTGDGQNLDVRHLIRMKIVLTKIINTREQDIDINIKSHYAKNNPKLFDAKKL